MAAEPLMAKCRHCSNPFELTDLVERRDGACPRCGVELAPRFTTLIIEEADKLQGLHDAFIRALRRVTGVPGNLQLQATPVLHNLATEVPWDEQLSTQPQQIADQVDLARRYLDDWTAAGDTAAEPAKAETAAEQLRQTAAQLRTLGSLLDITQDLTGDRDHQCAGDPARDAAHHLDTDAAELTRGRRTPAQLAESLDAAIATANNPTTDRT